MCELFEFGVRSHNVLRLCILSLAIKSYPVFSSSLSRFSVAVKVPFFVGKIRSLLVFLGRTKKDIATASRRHLVRRINSSNFLFDDRLVTRLVFLDHYALPLFLYLV